MGHQFLQAVTLVMAGLVMFLLVFIASGIYIHLNNLE